MRAIALGILRSAKSYVKRGAISSNPSSSPQNKLTRHSKVSKRFEKVYQRPKISLSSLVWTFILYGLGFARACERERERVRLCQGSIFLPASVQELGSKLIAELV